MAEADGFEAAPTGGTRGQFGDLLRTLRLAAALSQEDLAERAGISLRGLSDLERGERRRPRMDTVHRLAEALGLEEGAKAAFVQSVVRTSTQPMAPAPAEQEPAPTVKPVLEVPLPTGTLTFLLTDIEGSTTFWELHPTTMQSAIARHDALMDELLARHGGRQVKERGEGDSILAVFTSPSSALTAVCALQAALLAEPWPAQTPLQVRMGLHTGEAELRGIGYYGVTVNRTARIRSLAHGRQILVSQATADLVRQVLPAGTSLRALGAHQLKGLAQPEAIYQVLHPGLPADFPPLPSAQIQSTNLAPALTNFIGREREQGEVRVLLQAPPGW